MSAPTFKWYKNGVEIVGQISNTLDIVSADLGKHNGVYSATATNYLSTIESASVTVSVLVSGFHR